jgi:hypothetical protein
MMGFSIKDDIRYAPSDCFETFPFPVGYERALVLDKPGREYYEFRASLMIRNQQGMTKTYDRFHDPEEHRTRLIRLDRHPACRHARTGLR